VGDDAVLVDDVNGRVWDAGLEGDFGGIEDAVAVNDLMILVFEQGEIELAGLVDDFVSQLP